MTESKTRSLIKAISWRVCGTLATIVLVYLFTKKMDISVMVGGLEAAVKMILYYLHERFWNGISTGKKKTL